MSKRPRRGLANLSDSDEDVLKGSSSTNQEDNSKSIFDTKVFTDDLREKLRQEEQKIFNKSNDGDDDDDNDDCVVVSASVSSLEQGFDKGKESRITGNAAKRARRSEARAKYLEQLMSSSDEEDSEPVIVNDKIEILNDSISSQSVCQDDDEIFEMSVQDDKEDEQEPEYRVLVKMFQQKSVWVRLKETDTMEKVFLEISNQCDGGEVVLMGEGDGENREEILPTQTVKELGMSPELCFVVHAFPVSSKKAEKKPEFSLRFITSNRKQTKEIECNPSERFKIIFERYCNLCQIPTDKVQFKFDGDVLLDRETPDKYSMESGEQIEAFYSEELIEEPQRSNSEGPRRSLRSRVWSTLNPF